MFHRKLLPNSTSPTNLTICTDYEGCDTYVDPDTTPISLPWPPSPTPQSVSSQSSLSPYVIVVIVILACVFVLVSCSAAVVKYWGSWTFFRRRAPSARSNVSDQEEDLEYQDLDRGLMDSEIEHPIWLIRTAGLQQTLINSITVVKFKKGEYLIEGTDCSVCLSEFQDGETLRVLPKCNHAFHISCIDTWLRSHTNCPLCRAGVVSNPGRPSLASNDQSSGESRRTEVTNHVEGSEISDAVVSSSRCANSRSSGDGDNRNGAAAGEGFELVRLNHDLIKVDLNNLNRQNYFFNNHHDLNDVIQSVRRSNSMEHSPAAREDSSVHYSVNNIASSSESDGNAALNHRFVGSSSLAQTRSFPMKRSSSWCGRVSSARYGHASNSKLSP